LFGTLAPLALELAPLDIAATRRAAVLLMEAELLAAHGAELQQASPRLRSLLSFAEHKTAVDFARADRRLDQHVIRARRLFEQFDVILLPTVASGPPHSSAEEPAHLADFTALASLAGCPALSLPLSGGIALQLVGAPGSDLRLLELGEVLSAVIESTD
jgi:Asp-tRNA(Asn)/Glu-tRNA(Gln) amidotransferase A subunit family amidase